MNAILAFFLRLLFVVLSYSFVGWVGYTIFTDLRGTIRKQKEVTAPPINLTAKLLEKTLEKRFVKPEVILGRDPACDFPLEDETISLRHCKLSFHNKQWWAEDLDSTNGSYLNETLIEDPIVLTSSDELRLGHIEIAIKIN